MRQFMTMVVAAIGIALCAAAPAAADDGEVFTAQTGEGQYAVIFRGDRSMNRREVAQKAIESAARLTLDSGNEWFMVTQTQSARIDLNTAGTLSELGRTGASARDTGAGAGSGAGASGGGGGGVGAATSGVDPGAVGVGTGFDPRLVERSRPRFAYQTTLLIQVGRRGQEVHVENPTEEQQIFDAASIVAEAN